MGVIALVPTTAFSLTQIVQTSGFVNCLQYYVAKVLRYQQKIGERLDIELQALKDRVMWLGNQVHTLDLKTQHDFSTVCVAGILHHESAHPWSKLGLTWKRYGLLIMLPCIT